MKFCNNLLIYLPETYLVAYVELKIISAQCTVFGVVVVVHYLSKIIGSQRKKLSRDDYSV